MTPVPRFRFAPNPTGIPHISNLHTALFSWALARAMDGDFIVRIEDSDPAPHTPAATQQMLDALTWLGLDWDEGPDIGGDYGPYIQSQRLPSHQRVIAQLLDGGAAYYGDDPQQPTAAPDQPLRLRMPKSGQTTIEDGIRGPITFTNQRGADPILVRRDGRPLYHLAAMVDDYEMGITHVVRGEGWIDSTPIHVQLYRALGWPEPVWIHVPLLHNRRGQKLSKRDPQGGYLISDFQEAGYLPAAVFNYLLLLGWTPDDTEEIVDKWIVRQQFRLERLSPAPARFDWDKLNWVNRVYLQRMGDEALAAALRPFLEDAYGLLPSDKKWLVRLTGAVRADLNKLEDVVMLAGWAFSDGYDLTPAGERALASDPAPYVLTRLIAELATIVLLDEPTAHNILTGLQRSFHATHGWEATAVLQPVQAALTGDTHGPLLPVTLSIIGKQNALQRVADGLKYRL